MKEYMIPDVSVLCFEVEDILTTSDNFMDDIFAPCK